MHKCCVSRSCNSKIPYIPRSGSQIEMILSVLRSNGPTNKYELYGRIAKKYKNHHSYNTGLKFNSFTNTVYNMLQGNANHGRLIRENRFGGLSVIR
jgi:hypothetical protein